MIASLTISLLVTLSGAVASYLYDERASLGSRLCSGACLGLGVLGLSGFVIASSIGLGNAVVIATCLTSLPLLLLLSPKWLNPVKADLSVQIKAIKRFFAYPDTATSLYVGFYFLVAIVFWLVFSRAMIVDETGVSTGLLNNFGDLPFHLSVISGFAFGNNFPPEDPTYAGVSFTYPFISDFIAAMFVRCGASLQQSMLIENLILALSFVGLLHRWAWVLLRDRLAAVVTPLLVLLNGGFGWVLLFSKANENESGLLGVLSNLPPSLTVIPETTWRWGNAVSALLVPQRGFLLGLPLTIIVFTQWWLAIEREPEADSPAKVLRKDKKRAPALGKSKYPVRRMIAAGVAAGLLPLIHAHSFVVVMVMAALIALLIPAWREWITFMVVACVIAIPQLLWSTTHSAVNASSFFAWEVGWDHGQENPIWFWFKNTALFIPLIVAAILIRGDGYLIKKRLLLFYLPFTLCFIVPNFLKMAPWIWDNIKVLYYWWVASAPLVALLLARLWRQGGVKRVTAAVLFFSVILAGTIEVAGIALQSGKYALFDTAGIRFAEIVKQQTPPRSLIMHAPVHNHPAFLTGRRSLMGYPGHIWTHGLEFVRRESDVKRMYQGGTDAEQLMHNYQIQYVVVGPLERLIMPVNEQFFSRYPKVGEVGEYKLYKVQRQ